MGSAGEGYCLQNPSQAVSLRIKVTQPAGQKQMKYSIGAVSSEGQADVCNMFCTK